MSIFRVLCLFFVVNANLWAEPSSHTWYQLSSNKQAVILVDLFMTSSCPYCHKEDAFIRHIESQNPWLKVQRHYIDKDKNALIYFNQLLTQQNMNDFSVPSLFFCNSRWVGFAGAETTGNDLLNALSYCKQQIERDGKLTPIVVNVLKRKANATLFDTGMVDTPSPLYYIIGMAVIDACNPCALFVFASLLALLLVQNSKKEQLITGGIYVTTGALIHYFQQTNPNAYFSILPWLRFPAAIVGLMCLYLVLRIYQKRTTQYGMYLLAFLIALMMQTYQQTCLQNWSYIFEQWLNNQQFTAAHHALYQLFYQLTYVLCFLLVVYLYVGISRLTLFNKFRKQREVFGVLLLLFMSFILILYPMLLAHFALSLGAIVLVLLMSFLIIQKKR